MSDSRTAGSATSSGWRTPMLILTVGVLIAVLTNGPRTGRYQVLVEPRQWRSGLISRADVADFLVRQIDDDGLVGKTPVISY